MGKYADINIGDRFGKWTVTDRAEKRNHYICKCDCGKTKSVLKYNLRKDGSGSTSCGCKIKESLSKTKSIQVSERMIGNTFGRLTVTKWSHKKVCNYWLCQCNCGNTTTVDTSSLIRGNTTSCGCIVKERARKIAKESTKDRTGNKYGRLMAIAIVNNTTKKGTRWLCECSCGNKIEVSASGLACGKTKSCGCLKKEVDGTQARKHGQHKSKTYNIWRTMRARCRNKKLPHYDNYGGRGIAVCERWLNSFENFFEDMGECPKGRSIDRIDNDGNYEPGNCRWATPKEQANNTRKNVIIEYNSQKLLLGEWAKIFNIPRKKLYYRIITKGWPLEKAFSQK